MYKKLQNDELNRISAEEMKSVEKNPVTIVLDNIRSLNNIGSVFRTADAFLMEQIYLCGITATPPHRDIQKTALGATETVNWKHFNTTLEAIELLKQQGYKIAAVEQTENSTFLNEFNINKDEKWALVFGNEVSGVDQEVINCCDVVVEIPQFGSKHSLNISVSAGVVLWEMLKQYR
ncbi:MAG: RNA methyltransferase [Flavobacteriales bacterium]|nr:RNA methyltransferase [Flavobacteriales bacterium]MBV6485687.1 tRNA (guanosine(18)-2'-O)-methyltransferase [Flavobacteriales bacterium]MBX2959760.1 RNA methyltransferase [Flavobacteriales bacterium]